MITLQADFNHLDPQGRLRLDDLRMHRQTPFAAIVEKHEPIAIVLETLATGQGSDPEFLQKWENDAVKFSIAEGETKALALKVSFP